MLSSISTLIYIQLTAKRKIVLHGGRSWKQLRSPSGRADGDDDDDGAETGLMIRRPAISSSEWPSGKWFPVISSRPALTPVVLELRQRSPRPAVTFPAARHHELEQYKIIPLGDRGRCLRTACPRLLSETGTTGTGTRNVLSCESNALTITRPDHYTTSRWRGK